MRNEDRQLCKTCKYRALSRNNMGNRCDYIYLTGISRGCSVEDCDMYELGTIRRKRKKIKRYGWIREGA